MIEAMLLNALADPVIVLEGMQVTLANNAARSLLGAHIVGDDIRLTLRQPEAAALLASGGDGLAEFSGPGGPDQRLEMRVQAAANGQRVIQIADGSTRHLADRLRTDFVANASHELRTPLATILGFIETLSDEEAGGNSTLRQRFLHVMGSEARRMARLIEELLSLSRIEADRFVLPDTEVHLANLMREVLGETIDADMLQFDLSVNPVIRGDAAQLRQVVHNLIDNARRYGGGDISLQPDRTRRPGGHQRDRPGVRHRARTPAAPDATVLPRRRSPQPRVGWNRPGSGHRQAHRRPTSWPPRHPQSARPRHDRDNRNAADAMMTVIEPSRA